MMTIVAGAFTPGPEGVSSGSQNLTTTPGLIAGAGWGPWAAEDTAWPRAVPHSDTGLPQEGVDGGEPAHPPAPQGGARR